MQKKLYRVEMAGHTLKVYSAKTYIVAIGRETKVTLENGQVLVPFALKLTETDRFVAAQRRVRDEAKHLAPGCELAIIELATGERVWH